MIVEQASIRRKEFSLLRIGPCPISQAVAVGGGGTPNNAEGGGSGYVSFSELTPTSSFLRYEVTIGSADNPTNVTNVGSGKVVLEALPGRGGGFFNVAKIFRSVFLPLFKNCL